MTTTTVVPRDGTHPGPGRPSGFKGSPNRDIQYDCARCDATPGREGLVAVRVQFVTIGKPQRLIRSRTTEWICNPCMEQDPAYNQEALTDAPGMKDVKYGDEG